MFLNRCSITNTAMNISSRRDHCRVASSPPYLPPLIVFLLARLGASLLTPDCSMDRSRSTSITPPPAPRTQRSSRSKRRHRGYSLPRREKSSRRRSEVTLLLCVFNSSSHNWSTQPLRFDASKINDRELWTDIREIFHAELHPLWQRVLGFKRVKSIVPIAVRPDDFTKHLAHSRC